MGRPRCDTCRMPAPRFLTLPAPAKLNLFLHITGRRPDGYHDLQTAFQLLDRGDELTFANRDDGELLLRCSGPRVIDGFPAEHNLVYRAAKKLRAHCPEAGERGAHITLDKRLPSGGGLGGGSSDAASTLLALNALWGLHRSVDELAELGRELGADVPVFVRGYSAWAEGTGERLTPMALPERWFVIIYPGRPIATSVIFSHPELTRDTPPITMAAFFAGSIRNDCESLVRRLAEPVNKALIWLQNFGEARMTGSGACVFAAFAREVAARDVQARVPAPWESFVARGVNRSPAWERLDASRLTQ